MPADDGAFLHAFARARKAAAHVTREKPRRMSRRRLFLPRGAEMFSGNSRLAASGSRHALNALRAWTLTL
jgi:hypothetical protein